MLDSKTIVKEYHHIEVDYFTETPPDIIWHAASTHDQLTPDEWEEAADFFSQHGGRLQIDAKSFITNEQIVEAVEQAGGQGPILVRSYYDYTISGKPDDNDKMGG